MGELSRQTRRSAAPTLSPLDVNETDAIRYRRDAKHMHELGEWDWWYAPPYNVLHAAEVEFDPNEETAGDGVTACGWKAHLRIPGLFSRMGLRRCAYCCRKLGYPRGTGSPKNDKKCRPLVKRRLKAVR